MFDSNSRYLQPFSYQPPLIRYSESVLQVFCQLSVICSSLTLLIRVDKGLLLLLLTIQNSRNIYINFKGRFRHQKVYYISQYVILKVDLTYKSRLLVTILQFYNLCICICNLLSRTINVVKWYHGLHY